MTVDEITRYNADWLKAWTDKDVPRLLSFYAADTVYKDPQVPAGLNAAIRATRHEIVVRVDGHGLLADGYIRTAVRLLRETGAVNVGGVMHAEGVTVFERSVAMVQIQRIRLKGIRRNEQAEPSAMVEVGGGHRSRAQVKRGQRAFRGRPESAVARRMASRNALEENGG